MRTLSVATMLIFSVCLGAPSSYGKPVSLIGSWQGGGTVQPNGGAKEKTRCRARIEKSPGKGLYQAIYKCSSSLGLISQTVNVKKTSSNKYLGTFHNTQYNVKGIFSILLQGNKHSVKMKSSSGAGWINFNRQ